jgi:SAM-dependent methyltransferase
MKQQPQSVSDRREPGELSYFELQSTWGVTKHLGGTAATDELVSLCQIDRDAYVLEVGCGTGLTPRYLAQTVGCRVVGVDLSERMITWSRRRVQRTDVADRVTLNVADAQHLPFADGTFDAVICESVTAFVPDKPRAVAEYARVTRPGGYVGLTEGVWITPPPAELATYLGHVMAGADFQASDGWKALLEGAGLTDLVALSYSISARSHWKGEMGRMDRDDFRDYLHAWRTFGSLLLTSAAFRQYIHELWPPRSILHMFDYFGYGVFVGRKPAA